VFDAARGRIVLVGNARARRSDPGLGMGWPPLGAARHDGESATALRAAIAYDVVRRRALLFGDGSCHRRCLAGYLDVGWQRLGAGRAGGAAWPVAPRGWSTKPIRTTTVMFAAQIARTFLDDTWIWNVCSARATPSSSPALAAITDGVRRAGHHVAVGARMPARAGPWDTVEWDGLSWRDRTPTWARPHQRPRDDLRSSAHGLY